MKNLLWTFLISMVPIIELRGAIPAAALLDVPWYFAYPAAVIGNLLPVPFILFFIEKIFAWMKKVHLFPRLIHWLEEKAQKGAAKVEKYAKILYAQARLIEGLSVDNPTELSNMICELML